MEIFNLLITNLCPPRSLIKAVRRSRFKWWVHYGSELLNDSKMMQTLPEGAINLAWALVRLEFALWEIMRGLPCPVQLRPRIYAKLDIIVDKRRPNTEQCSLFLCLFWKISAFERRCFSIIAHTLSLCFLFHIFHKRAVLFLATAAKARLGKLRKRKIRWKFCGHKLQTTQWTYWPTSNF